MPEERNRMAKVIRQVVLQCVQPSKGHNKYYEISYLNVKDELALKKQIDYGNQHYGVECRWGRIENFKIGNPQHQTKKFAVTPAEAKQEIERLIAQKKAKGYKLVKDITMDEGYLNGDEAMKAITTPEFDRTAHVEVSINWWETAAELIEERVI